jgi:hypothetical protein
MKTLSSATRSNSKWLGESMMHWLRSKHMSALGSSITIWVSLRKLGIIMTEVCEAKLKRSHPLLGLSTKIRARQRPI